MTDTAQHNYLPLGSRASSPNRQIVPISEEDHIRAHTLTALGQDRRPRAYTSLSRPRRDLHEDGRRKSLAALSPLPREATPTTSVAPVSEEVLSPGASSEQSELGKIVEAHWPLCHNRKDVLLTFYGFLFFVGSLFVVSLANASTDRAYMLNPSPEGNRLLPDFLMMQTRDWFVASKMPVQLSEYLLVSSYAIYFLRAFSLGRNAATLQRRTFYVLGCLYLLRAACVTMTFLPNPLEQCVITLKSNVFLDAIDIFLGQKASCSDVFFSGHSIIYSAPMLAWATYTMPLFGIPSKPIFLLAFLHTCFAYLTLIMSTYHYTIDVAMAFILSLFVWMLLHLTWSHEAMQQYTLCRVLKRLDYHGVVPEQSPGQPHTLSKWLSPRRKTTEDSAAIV